MTWEAIGAIGSILSASVIAVTAVFGYRQLRALRLAAQLEGFLELHRELDSAQMDDVRSFVTLELPALLNDEQFCAELTTGRLDRRRHKELFLGNFMNTVGMLVFYRALDERLFIETYAYLAPRAWEQLRPVASLMRQSAPLGWQHFEYFARKCSEHKVSSLNRRPFFGHDDSAD